jgi:hypothetical protein
MQNSTLLVAVSATCNPRGTWHRYAISVDTTGNAWLDFPNVGFNSKWITITGNMFPNVMGGASGAVVYVIDYAGIMSGSGATYVQFSEPGSFTLCPAITYDTAQQNMFLVDVHSSSSGRLHLWKIQGSVNAPVISSVGYPASAMSWQSSGPGFGADFASQLGTNNKIDAGDDRIHRLVYRNNSLWCAHTVFLPSGSTANHCSIMWWQIDTLAVPIQNGLIDDPLSPGFFVYPSIAVNAHDDALIGFGYLNKFTHPSCAYSLRMHTDPLDSMSTPVIFRHGLATYYETFGTGRNRWGDYSATCVDPRNNTDFWTLQESSFIGSSPNWDTWWAHIAVPSGGLKLAASTDTLNINVNDTIMHPGTPQCGSTLTWNLDGGISVPGSGTNTQIVQWATVGWKVVTLTDSIAGSLIIYTDSILVRDAAGVNSVGGKSERVQIIPNPNTGAFDILFKEQYTGLVTIKLYNAQGSVVYSNDFNGTHNNKVSIETSHLSQGIYLVNIIINSEVITEQIAISN